MKKPIITLTGIDAATDLTRLPKHCEIGILYTETPEGRNRYPEKAEIKHMVDALSAQGQSIALHVCGMAARHNLLDQKIDDITRGVQRIQVNGHLTVDEVTALCEHYPQHTLITQHNATNAHLLDVMCANHALLIDASGGRGLSPEHWVAPATTKRVGFAGGLGPDNLLDEFSRIKPAAKHGFWLDMEGKLRDQNDRFDVERARAVVEIATRLQTEAELAYE